MEEQTTLTNQSANNFNPLAAQLPFIISKTTNDMRFVGLFYMIYGILCCLTIIGAIAGVPLLISGIRLREAADEFAAYRDTNFLDRLYRGFERQGKYFFIQKVLIIIGIVIFVLYIILIVMLLSTGMFSMLSGLSNMNSNY